MSVRKHRGSNTKLEIIEALMEHGDMSRAGLAKLLSLSKPATADNIESLLQAGLVEEVGEGTSTPGGGRKPILLRFNQEFKAIVAVDISNINPTIAVGDMKGFVLTETSFKIDARQSGDEKVALLIREVKKQIEKVKQIQVGVIVLALPGIFTEDNKLVFVHPQHYWAGFGLFDTFKTTFGLPVMIKNDMSAAVLGEHTLGNGMGCKSMAYISCGVGIGAGLIIDGKLYEGKNYAAGEISFFVDRKGIETGNTVENRVSIGSLLERISQDILKGKASKQAQQLSENKEHLEFTDIIQLVDQEDPYILELLKQITQEIGVAISGLSALLDIERVVIGGEYLHFYDTMFPYLYDILTRFTPFPPKLLPSKLGRDVGIIGGLIFGRDFLLKELIQ